MTICDYWREAPTKNISTKVTLGVGKIHLAKNREEINLNTKKKNLNIFPVFGRFGLIFPVFMPHMTVLANVRTRYSKILTLRVNCSQIQ